MSVEKTLEKLLRGESDANIRFEELCHLLQAKGFRMRVSGSHHIFTQAGVMNASTSSARARKPSHIKFDKSARFWQTTNCYEIELRDDRLVEC